MYIALCICVNIYLMISFRFHSNFSYQYRNVFSFLPHISCTINFQNRCMQTQWCHFRHRLDFINLYFYIYLFYNSLEWQKTWLETESQRARTNIITFMIAIAVAVASSKPDSIYKISSWLNEILYNFLMGPFNIKLPRQRMKSGQILLYRIFLTILNCKKRLWMHMVTTTTSSSAAAAALVTATIAISKND